MQNEKPDLTALRIENQDKKNWLQDNEEKIVAHSLK